MYFARFAPDGDKMAYDLYDQNEKNIDIWTYDIKRNVTTRLTFSKDPDLVPLFTKDGKKIIYTSQNSGGVMNHISKMQMAPGMQTCY